MKNKKESHSEKKIREEFEKMKKCAFHKQEGELIRERQFFTPGDTSMGIGGGRSVSTLANDYVQKFGAMSAVGGSIKPSEALVIAIMRALESGAPVNNIGFYDEVNWHLKNLHSSSVQPIVIKETLLKLLKKGVD